MMKNITDMDLCTTLEGISLISKLFSRLSPNFGSSGGIQTSNILESTVLTTTTPPTSPLHQSVVGFDVSFEQSSSISHCIELSKELFAIFVLKVVLKDDSKNLSLVFQENEAPMRFKAISFFNENNYPRNHSFCDTDSHEEINSRSTSEMASDEHHDVSNTIANTFKIFCQYLVRISCFPISVESSARQRKGWCGN